MTAQTTKDKTTNEELRNRFIANLTKKNTLTWNGAVSNSSTGDVFVDQFGKAGTYNKRPLDEVFSDMGALWSEDPEKALRLAFYLRIVTRKTKGWDGDAMEAVQKGQGRKAEFHARMLYVALFHWETFQENLPLIPLAGSWKDLWEIMLLGFDAGLDRTAFFDVLTRGIGNDAERPLVLKYMPLPKSKKKRVTERSKKMSALAVEYRTYLGLSDKEYRRLKAAGTGHEFQKLISRGLYDKLKFNEIPGKALNILANSDFFTDKKLDKKFEGWLEQQPMVHFNGYPYELAYQARTGSPLKKYQRLTIDKQFEQLLATAREDQGGLKGNVWCALDTSGSMSWDESAVSGNIKAIDACVGLGIYFSALNTGVFKDSVVLFSDVSEALILRGSFCDKVAQVNRHSAFGSTNFQSVIEEMVRIRVQRPDVPESDFPETLLVISDMQFNPSDGFTSPMSTDTNYEAAMRKLRDAGFSDEFIGKFKVVWWYCSGAKTNDYPSTIDDAGTYVFSGFDGAVLTLLLGGEQQSEDGQKKERPSMKDAMELALSQELLTCLKVVD